MHQREARAIAKLLAYTFPARFEWDEKKAATNQRVHGVSFQEACELFATEALVLEIYDLEHSDREDRFKSIGPIARGVVLVVWTERSEDVTRIVSAWWATKQERDLYTEYVRNQ